MSAAVVAGVLLWTRGTSRQLQVERRIDGLAEIAREAGVPLAPLLAVCIAEAFRPRPRPDRELARALAAAVAAHPDQEAAVRSLFEDSVEARMTVDLLRRNRRRWRRLAE